MLPCLKEGGHKGIFESLREEVKVNGKLSHRIFRSLDDSNCHPIIKENPDDVFILKDVIGRSLVDKYADIFPSDHDVSRSRPIFLFRNPDKVYGSGCKLGWYNHPNDITSMFENSLKLYNDLKSSGLPVSLITAESLRDNPEKIIRKICEHWDVEFTDEMVNWRVEPLKKIFDSTAEGITESNKCHIKLKLSSGIVASPRTSSDNELRLCTQLQETYDQILENEIDYNLQNHSVDDVFDNKPLFDMQPA